MAIIDKQGSENVGLLLPILENYLDKKVWYSFSSCYCMVLSLAATSYFVFSSYFVDCDEIHACHFSWLLLSISH